MITLKRKLNSTQDAINIAKIDCQARGRMLNVGGVRVPDGSVEIECNIGMLLVILCPSGLSGSGARKVCFSSKYLLNGETIKRADLEKIIKAA
jgi:hypothetical protein